MFRSRFLPVALGAALAFVFLLSCNSGPSAPQPGTPAFYWAAANENWKIGDYVKTLDNLAHITDTQNDFTARARPWQIVAAAGVAQGYLEVSQAFEDGARATRFRPAEFLRPMNAWRTSASRVALQLAENFGRFSAANQEQAVRIEFPWPPAGNAAPPPKLEALSRGTMPSQAQIDEVERAMVQRDVVRAAARAAGAGDDLARGQGVFQSPAHTVAAETFNTGIARSIFDLAALYGPAKMDMPNKRDFLYAQAMNVLKLYPKNRDAADITTKIQKDQQKKRTI
jgi:hypothetical protein